MYRFFICSYIEHSSPLPPYHCTIAVDYICFAPTFFRTDFFGVQTLMQAGPGQSRPVQAREIMAWPVENTELMEKLNKLWVVTET